MAAATPQACKEVVQERFCNWQVSAVHFTALNADEISRYGELEVVNSMMYDQTTEQPLRLGPLDRHLGTGSKRDVCGTCGQRYEDCVGHFGHVKLALPVFHAGYFRHTTQVLQCICKSCSRLLLPPEERSKCLSALRKPTTDDLRRDAIHKRVIASCKKVKTCPYCSYNNVQVRKGVGLPLICKHAVGPTNKSSPGEVSQALVESFGDASQYNSDIGSHASKAHEDLNPLTAYNLLVSITAQDRELLGFIPPERLIMTSVPVPPNCIRPTVSMGEKGSREDDISQCILEIVEANNWLKKHLVRGFEPRSLLESWQFLQEKCAVLINSEFAGLNLPKGRPIRSLCARLKGKEGRFRGNLSGKRVDFSGRTVISPDPNVSVEELVVPEWMAKRMTYPEKVCDANIERLRDAVKRGPEAHPGAAFVRFPDGRTKFLGALRKNFRRAISENLQCGDTVERHMHDGDVVLFNRQPSLHKLSIMAHKAKVMPGRTLRFNECACSPYNADFDGDEMNLHLPQTEEARSEAMNLMGIRHGLVTPKSGEVAVCATQDFLTGAFLMTQRDVFMTRDRFCQCCTELSDGVEAIQLPPPAILKPVELWTGKQVISVMLRPNLKSKVLVNLEAPEKNYSKKGESMCPRDGYVIFRNSELLCGNLGKKILGGAKNALFFRLLRDNSADAAVACMSRLAKATSRWLMNRGMTIGIDDVNGDYARGPSKANANKPGVHQEKRVITDGKYAAVDAHIRAYNAGTLQLKPGCNAEQTLEALVNGELGSVRDLIGGVCERTLPFMNKPRIMATCGSKGSAINLCQMMACLGQQNVAGARIKNGFVNRTLPHFMKGSKEPGARGYVENSFYSGLTPPEFFFHTMGGREGLVDTAVKTAETGYMARRLMKALEDLSLKYDLTVRTSSGDLVQFAFGDDCLNPAKMEGDSVPLDFDYVMKHVCCVLQPPRLHAGPASQEAAQKPTKRVRFASNVEVSDDATLGVGAPLAVPKVDVAVRAGAAARRGRAEPIRRSPTELQNQRFLTWPLLPWELEQLSSVYAASFLAWVKRTHGEADVDISHAGFALANYIRSLGKRVVQKRQELSLEAGDTQESASKAISEQTLEDSLSLIDSGMCPTQCQLEAFVNRCSVKYVQAQLMPGEAVGAVAAQSIAEPATQMTLKTFHFAGVASMNVTLGVPRIKEIINGAKTISTPIITCKLVDEYSEIAARIVKGRIESKSLADVALYFKEVYDPAKGVYISVKLDLDTIRKLQLELTMNDIRDALLKRKNMQGMSLAPTDVEVVGPDKIRVKPPFKASTSGSSKMLYFNLQQLKKALPKAVVQGLPSALRAVINRDDTKGPTRYEVLVEGYGFKDVLATPGVQPSRTTSNHVDEVEKVLGIEAARKVIMKEIATTMGGHGIAVDIRHIQMLGDCMTYRGAVLGINRFGIARMRTSALMLASFERTTDLLFDAAARNKVDPILGVSESIIMGSTINLGTGLFKVLYDSGGKQRPPAAASSARAAVLSGRAPLLEGWKS